MALIKTNARGQSSNLGRRNLVINGAMQVAQRGTSQASISSAGYYVQDRFKVNTNDAGVWTQTQESLTTSDTPFQNGFTQALKLDCTTASASLAAAGTLQINQAIEGYNLQRLGSGSSSAKSITVSFWIKATKTGTNVLASYQDDGGKQVSATYTINVSNTWEFKTVTLPANTANAILNDNTRGRLVTWYFAAGSNRTSGTLRNTWTAYATADEAVGQVNHADNVANNIHITGIQVEVGDIATDFEHRSYAEELLLCKRYFQQSGAGSPAKANSTTEFWVGVTFSTQMRANPALSFNHPNNTVRIFEFGVGNRDSDSTPSLSNAYYNPTGCLLRMGNFSGISGGDTGITGGSSDGAVGGESALTFNFEAEL